MVAQFVWMENDRCNGWWCGGHRVPADQPVDYPEANNSNGRWIAVYSEKGVSKQTAYRKAREPERNS